MKHKCKEKKEECKCENREKEHVETIQRLQADFENYKKRVQRDQKEYCEFAEKALIEKLLPFIDNFDLAMQNSNNESKEEFIKAIEMVHKQLHNTLNKEGLKKINTKDQKFNPELHQPILQEESDKEPNTILDEIQPGYIFKDKILRHSKVKLSKLTGGK